MYTIYINFIVNAGHLPEGWSMNLLFLTQTTDWRQTMGREEEIHQGGYVSNTGWV